MAFSSAGIGRGQAVSQRDSAQIGADEGRVRLKLLSGSVSFSDGREMLDAFRHRYLLAHYVAFTILLLVLIYLLALSRAPISTIYPAILIGCAAALIAGWAYLALSLRLSGAGRSGPVSIRLEPGLLAAAIALVGAGWLVQGVIAGELIWSPGRAAVLILLAQVWLMLMVGFLMRRTLSRAAGRLRRDRQRAAERRPEPAAVQDPTLATEPTQEAEPQLDVAPPVQGAQSVLSAVLRLEASGNYVTVVTERGRRTVPGPFSAVVARMPREAGRQVHRSHWVARHAVIAERRVGRELRLQTVDGGSVPVSAAQVGAVRVWLAQGRAEGGVGS